MVTKEHIGKLVQYYDDGLRAGYLEAIVKDTAFIRPIKPYKGAQPRAVKIPIKDVILT